MVALCSTKCNVFLQILQPIHLLAVELLEKIHRVKMM